MINATSKNLIKFKSGQTPYSSGESNVSSKYKDFMQSIGTTQPKVIANTPLNRPYKAVEQNDNTYDTYYSTKIVHPKEPKGKLVKGSPLPNPLNTFRQLKDGAKTFGKALNGDGDDYTIGKLNDPALVLGSLSIATMLAAGAKSPFGKAMEFVGATTWLTSMSLWPKMFLNYPVKKMTGVDLNLEYINSQGQKKPFWMDSGYLPKDLLPKKMIHKAADKLNVPKDIKDREDVAFEKMRKVAVGTNTAWMLTAGFSTPFMSSLIADRMRAPVTKIIDGTRILAAEAKLEAAGIKTDSKNPMINVATGIVNIASKFKDPTKNEQAELTNLLDSNNSKDLDKFFRKAIGNSKVNEPARAKLSDAIKQGVEGNKLKPETKKQIKKIFNEAKDVAKHEKLWNNYFEATMDYKWGTQRQSSIKKLLKPFGITGKQEVQLAKSTDPIKQSEIIANSIKNLKDAKKSKLDIETIVQKPLAKVENAAKNLDKMTAEIGKKFEKSDFSDEVKSISTMFKNKTEDKLTNIQTSMRVSHLVEYGEEKLKPLAKIVRRFDDNDIQNNVAKIRKTKVLNEQLEKMYGKGNPVNKKLKGYANTISIQAMSSLDKDKNAGRVISWLGEPTHAMLNSAAKDNQAYKSWFKKIGGISSGLLLAGTGITLWNIVQNAKYKNEGVQND